MKFVEDNRIDTAQIRVAEQAAGEHAFCEEAETGAGAGDLFKADLIADCFSRALSKLGGYAASGQTSGDAARLQDKDFAGDELHQGRRDARGFARARRGFKNQIGRVALSFAQGLKNLRQQRVYRQCDFAGHRVSSEHGKSSGSNSTAKNRTGQAKERNACGAGRIPSASAGLSAFPFPCECERF
jgi:hypothetical protein